MRKMLLTLGVALLALAGCRREEPITPVPQEKPVDISSSLRFDLSFVHPAQTRGVKTDWVAGDKVFIFITGNTSGYVKASYDGAAWSASYFGSPLSAGDLAASGTLTAVYLPYAQDVAPSFGSAWAFPSGADSYFFQAVNQPYKVLTVEGKPTLTAVISMSSPGTYTQFYVPKSGATGTVQVACNVLKPAGLASVASDGTVTETSSGSVGDWITGYADTIDREEGYYVSGKLVDTPALDSYFVLNKSSDYRHFYRKRDIALTVNGAYRLPSLDGLLWQQASYGADPVLLGNQLWTTCNVGSNLPWGIDSPSWGYGPSYAFASVPSLETGRVLPSEADWTALTSSNRISWVPVTIGGIAGYVVASKALETRFIFLPKDSGGTDLHYWEASGKYLGLTAGEPAVIAGTPTSAYARAIVDNSTPYPGLFTIHALADNVTVTFQHVNDGIQWTKTPGDNSSWTDYKAKSGITLNLNECVYFRGKKANNASYGSKLVTCTGLYAVYGELMSLYCDDNYDPRTTAPTARQAFYRAFYQETNLRTIPGKYLTITIGSGSMGEAMFDEMFKGCTGIVDSPLEKLLNIPAGSGTPELSLHAFWHMFQDCTSLLSGPELPAEGSVTITRDAPYECMFMGCTSLVEAPALPYTTLAPWMYKQMFSGCTSLVKAPKLPAPTLPNNCYEQMFNGCTSLKSITCLATSGINSNNSTVNWVQNVPAGGSFIKAASASSWPTGNNGIPFGWTVQDSTP